jgi:hypothetical protein
MAKEVQRKWFQVRKTVVNIYYVYEANKDDAIKAVSDTLVATRRIKSVSVKRHNYVP